VNPISIPGAVDLGGMGGFVLADVTALSALDWGKGVSSDLAGFMRLLKNLELSVKTSCPVPWLVREHGACLHCRCDAAARHAGADLLTVDRFNFKGSDQQKAIGKLWGLLRCQLPGIGSRQEEAAA